MHDHAGFPVWLPLSLLAFSVLCLVQAVVIFKTGRAIPGLGAHRQAAMPARPRLFLGWSFVISALVPLVGLWLLSRWS